MIETKERIEYVSELEALVQSFLLDHIDYMQLNLLGNPEEQHNVKWARRLGFKDTVPIYK